jgi:uncharacterized membrane protein
MSLGHCSADIVEASLALRRRTEPSQSGSQAFPHDSNTFEGAMTFFDAISAAGYMIEAVGVLIIVAGSVVSSVVFVLSFRQQTGDLRYRAYRRQLGRSIILGLEFLIAGDIIRTVIVADTLENVAILGLIILIRSFLSVTLHLEVEGRWPWETKPDTRG